jgi:hypothetical protein
MILRDRRVVSRFYYVLLLFAISSGASTVKAQTTGYWSVPIQSPKGGDYHAQGVSDSSDNYIVVTSGFGLLTPNSNLGEVTNPGNIRVELRKYTPIGNRVFDPKIIEVAGEDFLDPVVTVDKADNIYVACSHLNPQGLFSDILIRKYSPTGELKWSRQYRYQASTHDRYAHAFSPRITVDSQGIVSIAGKLISGDVQPAAFVASWNTNGYFLGDYLYLPSSFPYPADPVVEAIQTDSSGNILVVGTESSQIEPGNLLKRRGFLLGFQRPLDMWADFPPGPVSPPGLEGGNNGKLIDWRGGVTTEEGVGLRAVCTDADSAIYVAGDIVRTPLAGGNGTTDVFVQRYNVISLGSFPKWTTIYDGGSSKPDLATKVIYSPTDQTIRVAGGATRPTSPYVVNPALPSQPVMLTLSPVTGEVKNTNVPSSQTGWDSYLDISLDNFGAAHFGGGANSDRLPYSSFRAWSYYSTWGRFIFWNNANSSFSRTTSVSAVPTGDAYTASVLGGGANGIFVMRYVYAPVAIDNQYNMFADQASVSDNVMLNDTRIKWPNYVSAELTSQPTHGTVTLESQGSFTYKPNPGFVGTDSFRYRIRKQVGTSTYVYSAVPDSTGSINRGRVFITVKLRPLNITNVSVTNIGANDAQINWTTDLPSSSDVLFSSTKPLYPNQTGSYTNGATGADGVTKHTVKLTNLSPGTLYYFLVRSGSSVSEVAIRTGTFLTLKNAPAISISSATLTRSNGTIVATVTLANTGGVTAGNVRMTAVSLGGVSAINVSVPILVGDIPAGASRTGILQFPGSLGSAGTHALLQISGSYTGGTFSSGTRVILP